MAMRYPGGLIATSPVNAAYPSGVWTQTQTTPYVTQNVWQNDQYWRNTTLLLHGDGTNGAQNNTFLDSSSNNFSITRNGNTTQGAFTPFQQNGYWSNYFDASAATPLNFPDNDAFTFNADFTVECWFFATTLSEQKILFGKWDNLQQEWLIAINTSNTAEFYWASYSLGSPAISSANAFNLNTWNHIAAVRSGSTITLYVNGVSVGTRTDGTAGTNRTSILTIGYLQYLGGNKFGGYISNVRVVKGTAVYTSNFTPNTSPLAAITNTQLLTCQSSRFIDNSTNNFTATVNGVSIQAFQPFPGPTTWSASIGGSGYFDGTGDNLSIANNAAFQFGSGDFTVEAWVYAPSNPPGIGSIVSHSDGASASGTQFLVRTEGGNTSVVAAVYSGGTGYVATWSSALPIGQWNHVAFTRSGTSTYLWVNGVQRATASVGSVSLNTTSTALTIGSNASASADNWLGYISGTRITKGAALYTATFTPPTAPPTTTVSSGTVGVLLNFTNAGIFDNAQMNDLETVGNAQISTSVVKYGTGSMAFDGSGDWLAGSPTPQTDLGSGDFTIEAWLYRTASGAASDSGIVSRGAPTTLNGFVFGYTSANVLVFNFNYSGAIVTGVTVIPANTWTHVAVSRNGNTFRLFVNGVLDATATSTNSQTTNAGDIFYVGRSGYDSGRIVTGYLDDVRITKGVARYISNFTPPIARMPNQ